MFDWEEEEEDDDQVVWGLWTGLALGLGGIYETAIGDCSVLEIGRAHV